MALVAGCATTGPDRAAPNTPSGESTPTHSLEDKAGATPVVHALLATETAESSGLWSRAEPLLDSTECQLYRTSVVGGAQGSGGWEGTKQWRLYRCSQPTLAGLRDAGYVDAFVRAGGRLIEGTLAEISPRVPPSNAESVLKVSYFNNIDPAARETDLVALSTDAAALENTWVPDGRFPPTASLGVSRPDTIDILYYQEPGQGQRFRDANPEILQRIGVFNATHTTAATYLGGRYTP